MRNKIGVFWDGLDRVPTKMYMLEQLSTATRYRLSTRAMLRVSCKTRFSRRILSR
jgi:hypothetical protein